MGKLTIDEAYRNLKEIYYEDDEHANEVWFKLLEAEGVHEIV